MYAIREDVGHTYSTRLRRTGRWAASKESEGRAESRKRMKYSSDRDRLTAKAVNRHHCFGHGTRSQAFEWAHGTTDWTAYFRCPRFHFQWIFSMIGGELKAERRWAEETKTASLEHC